MIELTGQDFRRRMPEASDDLRSRNSLWLRLRIDFPLLVLLLCLAGFGFIVLYSASDGSRAFLRQMIFFSLGLVTMMGVAQLHAHTLQRGALWFYLFAVALLVVVIFFGVGAKGAQRWISLGGFRFQPSELMKLALPIMVASYLARREIPPRFKHVFWSLVMVAIPVLLIIQQPDLGTSLLIGMSGLVALFLAGLRWRYIFGAVAAVMAGAWPMWQFVLHDYQKQRILTLFSPDADRLGAGWNIYQSKIAIGSGGLQGKGWMQGTQSHLDFLPESHTDFIIAVLAEEFGLVGVLALMALYVLIIGRGFIIALNAQDSFGRLLAGSITFTFFMYVLVNMGMVAGLLPVVGVPLPLVSYGGTALLTLMMGFGLLMSISTEPKRVTL